MGSGEGEGEGGKERGLVGMKVPPEIAADAVSMTRSTPTVPPGKGSSTSSGSAMVNFYAGGFAGMVGAALTCPLEVVKTRLQARENKHFITEGRLRYGLQTAGFLRNMYRKEGLRALWRGVDSQLIGVVPSRAIYFGTFLSLKDGFDRHYKKEGWQVPVFCSVMAGVVNSTLTSPIWVVKTRMQLQTNLIENAAKVNYKNSLDCAWRILREEGIFAFWKGLSASYAGVAEGVLQLTTYDMMKTAVQKYRYKKMTPEQRAVIRRRTPRGKKAYTFVNLSELEYFIMASISKVGAAIVTYPFEVVRTRLREERGKRALYYGMWQGLARIGREEGAAGFYGGMASHLLRVVPNAAIIFVAMETFMKVYYYFALPR